MKYDQYGLAYTTEAELCELLYLNPELDISRFFVENPTEFNHAVEALHADYKKLMQYINLGNVDQNLTVENFDAQQQSQWRMPDKYREMDIAKWILEQCHTEAELQRVGEELLLFQERDLFELLKWLKYFVDTMRANNIVWGVGRGSSVASYVLYLIGVHRINSMYYDLNIDEFLK
jgi:DNA polymerase III alpha subunit